MNDFTKEELEWLYHEITQIKDNHRHTHGKSIPIQEKLKSLIDNYDEDDKPKLMNKLCCGTKWIYESTYWSTPKCHLCGEKLDE